MFNIEYTIAKIGIIMDRLLEMEVFVAVNEMGSFNKAAERMHMSPPAITRAVHRLSSGWAPLCSRARRGVCI